jgi:hypothetical protein
MTEKSQGGSLYFVTLINDRSRKIFLYVLKKVAGALHLQEIPCQG